MRGGAKTSFVFGELKTLNLRLLSAPLGGNQRRERSRTALSRCNLRICEFYSRPCSGIASSIPGYDWPGQQRLDKIVALLVDRGNTEFALQPDEPAKASARSPDYIDRGPEYPSDHLNSELYITQSISLTSGK